jgi:hypothetical protein
LRDLKVHRVGQYVRVCLPYVIALGLTDEVADLRVS